VTINGSDITVSPVPEQEQARAMIGTTRTLISNMIHGVNLGWQSKLKLVGIGYRAKLEQDKLELRVGFSHPVFFDIPSQIKIETPDRAILVVSGNLPSLFFPVLFPFLFSCGFSFTHVLGPDKIAVTTAAANIRALKPPNAYSGHGIRYVTEQVTLKAGKKGA
jgi:large subunit ribosomal protein L6